MLTSVDEIYDFVLVGYGKTTSSSDEEQLPLSLWQVLELLQCLSGLYCISFLHEHQKYFRRNLIINYFGIII